MTLGSVLFDLKRGDRIGRWLTFILPVPFV
jgi:hypothetical protein